MEMPSGLHTLLAIKALGVVPGLSASERSVGAAIIDHFNRQTGQCDPSVERMAKMLCIDRATVIRATETLHRLDLIRKISHGGKSQRTSYIPNWDVLLAIESDWSARMKTGAKPATRYKSRQRATPNVAKMRRTKSRKRDDGGRNTVTQTCRSNASEKPLSDEEHASPAEPALDSSTIQFGRDVHLIPQLSAEEAELDAAQVRLNKDLMGMGQQVMAAALDLDKEVMDRATSAEHQQPGSGIGILVEAIVDTWYDRPR